MAETASKIGKGISKTSPLVGGVERKLRSKGFDPVETVAKKRREEDAAKKEQKEIIGKQAQAEELRLAEATDVIGRKGLLATTGGRQSLINTKRLRKVQGAQPLIPRS